MYGQGPHFLGPQNPVGGPAITCFVLLNIRNSLPLMAINTLIQMPYQWLCNPIIEISTIGYVIETLQNVIKMLKIPPTITVSACYYIS